MGLSIIFFLLSRYECAIITFMSAILLEVKFPNYLVFHFLSVGRFVCHNFKFHFPCFYQCTSMSCVQYTVNMYIRIICQHHERYSSQPNLSAPSQCSARTENCQRPTFIKCTLEVKYSSVSALSCVLYLSKNSNEKLLTHLFAHLGWGAKGFRIKILSGPPHSNYSTRACPKRVKWIGFSKAFLIEYPVILTLIPASRTRGPEGVYPPDIRDVTV